MELTVMITRQTKNPDWIFNEEQSEFINLKTGKVLLPAQYFDEIEHPPLAEVAGTPSQPTIVRLEKVLDCLLDLKHAFLNGNKWEADPNPNLEVGETGTGFWSAIYRKSSIHSSLITEVDRKFNYQAGCENKLHPTESDKPDFHNKSATLCDLIDTIYCLLFKAIHSLFITGIDPDLTDHNTLLHLMIDGITFGTISSESGEIGISSLLSQLDKSNEHIINLEQKNVQGNMITRDLGSRIVSLSEALNSAKKVKSWLWAENDHLKKQIDSLLISLKDASNQKRKLRDKLFKVIRK